MNTATRRSAKPISHSRSLRLLGLSALTLVLAGCVSTQPPRSDAWERLEQQTGPLSNPRLPDNQPGSNVDPSRPDNGFYLPGSGQLLASPQPAIAARDSNGDIKLNFQNANLLEVTKVVLGDMLGVNYVVDPSVQGSVTLQTSRPLNREALLPTLEMLLRMNGAALVIDGDLYRIVPLASAAGDVAAPQLGDSSLPLPQGYSVRLVPLAHIGADEMAQILEPFTAGSKQLLRIDSQRNLLVLAGSGEEMGRLLETIRIFDVDRMAGMSVALFTPEFVDAKTLHEELEKVLADKEQGLLRGLVRFEVIERLNGLMVVTPRPAQLAQVRRWVHRLDRDSGGAGQRLFFYRVHNGKAAELAEVLNKLFEPSVQTPAAELAPGLKRTQVSSAAQDEADAPTTPQTKQPTTPASSNTAGEGLAISENTRVKVIADEPNNALLILASGGDYRQILAALKQLDAVPLQVLVEVTIAEVTLTNNLEYGVEWFFKNKVGEFGGVGTLDLGASGIIGSLPGFTYALTKGNTVNGVLSLLDNESNISILSSPSLLVLNNQEARIQVGDEISIKTAEQSTVQADPNVPSAAVNSTFERRETGVMLLVKPRVNPGGLVIMDVEQEVSNVPQSDAASDSPRIQQRKIKTSVAVQSGDTVMLGGLIKDNRDRSEAGIPVAHKVPILGNLFGSKANNADRTELLVLITPRAITDRGVALDVTDEFRRKLNHLVPKQTSKVEPVADAEPN